MDLFGQWGKPLSVRWPML